MSRLLRLDPRQKAAIADELRDHLEERLQDLREQGLSRKDAVRRALDEFGDAAGLAAQFTSLSHRRRRRLLMRCTLATTVLAAVVFLAITLFHPGNPAGPPQNAVAQKPEASNQKTQTPKPMVAAALPEVLRQEVQAEFVDAPLKQALDFLSDQTKVTTILAEKALSEEGIAVDEPVNIATKAPFNLVLNRMLNPLELTWYYKDDILFVTTNTAAKDQLFTKYYSVKHILDRGYSQEDVMEMIELMTSGSWLNIDGIGGEMLFVGRVLTVRQTFHAQIEVAELLNSLHGLSRPLLRLEPKEHEKLRSALQDKTTVEFVDTPLSDVCEFLSDAHRVPIVLDVKALENEGLATDEPVHFVLKGRTLQTTLRLMFGPLELRAVLRDGVISITTNTEAEKNLSTVIYNVKQIADSKDALHELKEAVLTVTDGTWMEVDGIGGEVITFQPGTMIVRQQEPVHQQVREFLQNQFRQPGDDGKLKPRPPKVETRLYRMSADSAEDLLTALPEVISPDTWKVDTNKTALGTIRKVAAGQTFVEYPEEPDPPKKKTEEPKAQSKFPFTAAPKPRRQYIVVPQAVLIIRQTSDVHREIGRFLNNLIPGTGFGESIDARRGLNQGGLSGGGFFSVNESRPKWRANVANHQSQRP